MELLNEFDSLLR